MLLLIDSCQNRGSADQYHLNVSQVQFRPIEVESFLKLSADKSIVFKWSQVQVDFFLKFKWNMLCLCHDGLALLRFWFQTDLGRKNSPSYLKLQAWETFSYHGYALRLIFMHWLVKIWQVSSCLCSILKLVLTPSFVSTCDVFNCLFPLDVQNEIQLLSRVFCYSWLVCLLGFWLRNASLVKVGNPISDGIVFVFHLAWYVRGV